MNATNPAELKTLFESDAFARETTYTGPLGRSMRPPAHGCTCGPPRPKAWR